MRTPLGMTRNLLSAPGVRQPHNVLNDLGGDWFDKPTSRQSSTQRRASTTTGRSTRRHGQHSHPHTSGSLNRHSHLLRGSAPTVGSAPAPTRSSKLTEPKDSHFRHLGDDHLPARQHARPRVPGEAGLERRHTNVNLTQPSPPGFCLVVPFEPLSPCPRWPSPVPTVARSPLESARVAATAGWAYGLG